MAYNPFAIDFLMRLLVNTLAVFIAAYIVPGVDVAGFLPAFIAAVTLGILNAFLRPLLIFLTLPFTLITLGLFVFVINAVLVMLAAWIVPGFEIMSFWVAFLFALVLSFVNFFFKLVTKNNEGSL